MHSCYPASKRDRQFCFNGATDASGTELESANDLVWITRESGVPVDYWSDTYVDFEITRWGFYGPPTVRYEGCGRREPVKPVIGQIHPEIVMEEKDLEL